MRNRTRTALLAAAALGAAVIWFTASPRFLDRTLTKLLFGNSGFAVQTQNLRLAAGGFEFDGFVFSDRDGRGLLRSGAGRVRFRGLFFWKKADLTLKDVHLSGEIVEAMSRLSFGEARLRGEIRATEALVAIRSGGGTRRLHFLRIASPQAVLKGGVMLGRGRVLKANAVLTDPSGTPLFKARWHDIMPPS